MSPVKADRTRSKRFLSLTHACDPPVRACFLASRLARVNDRVFSLCSENLSLDSSIFSSPPLNFLQELPSYRSVARRRTSILARDKQSGTLLKPTDSYSSHLDGGVAESLNSQSIRKYALNISEKRRLRWAATSQRAGILRAGVHLTRGVHSSRNENSVS